MNAFQKTGEKMTNYRWTICAMLFFATTVNYLDRQVLSLTWDEFIKPEFHWNEVHYGTITRVKRSYSPWSSKIYTLRENPNRK